MKQWLAVVVAVFVLAGSPANAQTRKDELTAKLTHSLVGLHQQFTTQMAQSGASPFSSNDPLVRMVEDRVVVDAVASGDVNVLKSELESLGMQHGVAFGRIISGQLPISALLAAAGLASLRFAQPAAVMTHAGLVVMRANVARTAFGVNGSGIKVGVLSNSFNRLGGAAADVANGDLSPVTVIQEISCCTGATDEDRAMLQIVHDVAPGASRSFATGSGGQTSLAANIVALAAVGAKVIVDDALYLAEPMFQDGIIAQAVNSVVAGGDRLFLRSWESGGTELSKRL